MPRNAFLLALLVCPLATGVMAGVMQPGQWAIETTFEEARGPGAPTQLPGPQRVTACKSQAFVDRENYTSVEFAMRRLQRQQFSCQADNRQGDHHEASWQYTCERPDGAKAVNRAENKVSADRLDQVSTETTTVNGQLWSQVRVRVAGRLTGKPCDSTDIPLN